MAPGLALAAVLSALVPVFAARAVPGTMRLASGRIRAQAVAGGLFQSPITFGVTSGNDSLTAADLDGDGRQDHVVSSRSANSSKILLGNGSGGFALGQTFTQNSPYSPLAADLNRDGKLDLAFAIPNGGQVQTWVRSGNQFTFYADVLVGGTPTVMDLSDWNRDAIPDVMVADTSVGRWAVAAGDGNGTFATAFPLGTGAGSPASVVQADLDRDGLLDVLLACPSSNFVVTSRQYTPGGWSGGGASVGSQPVWVAVGDFNRDGKQDFVSANSGSGSVSVLFGDGAFSWSGRTDLTVGSNPRCAMVADFNRDGNPDIATANQGSNTVSILLGHGDGTFETKRDVPTGAGPAYLAVADFNGDGAPDLATANTSGSSVSILLSAAVAAAPNFRLSGNFTVDGTPVEMTTGDFNGDGIPDLATANKLGNDVSLLAGQSGGAFAVSPVSLSGNNTPTSLAAVDFDRNGTTDLVVNTGASSRLVPLSNDGSASFSALSTANTGSQPVHLAPIDFDRDGDPDVVLAKFSSGICMETNNGAGSFSPTFSPAQPFDVNATESVAVADFNRDGKQDLVLGVFGSSTVAVLKGTGTGASFQAPVFFNVGDEPVAVAAGDVNGDGAADIVSVNASSDSISVLLGDGSGAFGPQFQFPVGNNPQSVVIADFNRDGKADLAVSNDGGATSSVSVLLGNGTGSAFARSDFATPFTFAVSLVAADFNRDGRTDLAVADADASKVSVYLNTADNAPVANAGPDQTLESTGTSTSVVLDGTASSDPDGDLLSYSWSENGSVLGSGSTLGITTPNGTHTFTLKVTDPFGVSVTDTVTVTVQDTVAPVVAISTPADGSTVSSPVQVAADITEAGNLSSWKLLVDNVQTDSGTNKGAAAVNKTKSLADGQHTFKVTATDTSGNVGSDTVTFTVNSNGPGASITAPASSSVRGGTITITGTVSDSSNLAKWELFMDGTAAANRFAQASVSGTSASVNASFDTKTVSDGSHTITLKATDAGGATATATVTFTVDNTAPTIACPPSVTVSTDANACVATGVNLGSAFVLDANQGTTTNNSTGTFPKGVTFVTWTSTDLAGNTNSCQQKVTVNDTQAPGLTCPPDVVVNTDTGTNTATNVSLGTPLVSDNCPGVGPASNNAPRTYPLGDTFVTWTVTDGSGNTTTCQQKVTVKDGQAPTITCPSDVTVTPDAGQCTASGVTLGTPSGSDNSGQTPTFTNNAPATYPKGVTLVTWTAHDSAGNTTSCQQRVTVNDAEKPAITCPPDVIVLTDSGQCTASGVSLGTPTVSDNCPGVGSPTNSAPSTYPKGVTFVTWTVDDAAGNTTSCQQKVTVLDTEKPTITCPADVIVPTDAGKNTASGVTLGSPTAADNCPGVTTSNNAPSIYPKGVTLVTWTAVDSAGNTATCQQKVTVVDNQPPTITCPADVTASTDAGKCTASGVTLGTPVTSDNGPLPAPTNNAPSTYPKGVTIVTWTVTDSDGNTASCQQKVTVNDTEKPTISCPGDVLTITDSGKPDASGVHLGNPVFSDNCPGAAVSNNAPAKFPVGVTVVTWTVTDAAGNTATCQQKVVVLDNEKPTITCPPDVAATTDAGKCTASGVSLGNPIVLDNAPGATTSNNAPATFPKGVTLVTWSVVDASGNTASCQQKVTVTDGEKPTITCPADVTATTDSGKTTAGSVSLGQPSIADNCPGAAVTSNAPTKYPIGTTLVTWTVTDASGNTASCQQKVIVTDGEKPTITCPADVTVSADPGKCEAGSVNIGTPTVSDNAPGVTVSSNAPTKFPRGTTLVTWTALDAAGNTATCQQKVTVEDVEKPAITCPADVAAMTDSGKNTASNVVLGTPQVSDNCPGATASSNAPSTFPLGTTLVTWTATDASGNTATCQQKVVVTLSTPPTITAPADVTVSTDTGACTATGVALGTATFSDLNTGAKVVSNAPTVFQKGTTIVTWTLTDDAGTSLTAQQKVIVNDTEKPTITCPADVAAMTDSGKTTASGVSLGTPTTADNCPGSTVSSNAPSTFPVGVTTVTWTVTDASGNTASCQQKVTVTLTDQPSITAPADVSVGTDPGQCTATNVSLGTPKVTDPNSGVSVTSDAPPLYPKGVTLVTWTLIDDTGTHVTAQQKVTVTDTEKPSLVCPANIVRSTLYAKPIVVNYPDAVATDNCPGVTVTYSKPSGSLFTPGRTTTVVVTATDATGNRTTCSFTIKIQHGRKKKKKK